MKKLGLLFGLIALLCLGSCSDDNDNNASVPVFPEKQTIGGEVGNTKELTFEANNEWILTSSQTWCRFVADGAEEYALSGAAGKQTVTLSIGDEAWGNDAVSVAYLTLEMQGQRAIIGEVRRSAKGYEFKILDAEGKEVNDENPMVIGYDTYKTYTFEANFRFAATNKPYFVEVDGGTIVGTPQAKVTGGVKVLEDGSIEKYAIAKDAGYQMAFADEDGKFYRTVPIVFAGMDNTAMDKTTPTQSVWGWTVTLDGKTFNSSGNSNAGTSSSDVVYKGKVPFTVKALNDDITFVYMEQWKDVSGQLHIDPIEDESMLWMHCTNSKGTVALTVDPLDVNMGTTERTGYVLAFPAALYKQIQNGEAEALIDESGEIANRYQNNNLLIEITQKEVKQNTEEQSFEVKFQGYQDVEVSKVTDPSVISFIQGIFNTDKVYAVNVEADGYYQVNPMLDGWTGNLTVIDAEGNILSDIVPEISQDQSGTLVAGVSVPSKEIFVAFMDGEGNTQKVLQMAQGGGTTTDAVFKLTNNQAGTIAATAYTGTDASWLKSEYGVESIFQVSKPEQSIFIALASGANIASYKALDFDSEVDVTDMIAQTDDKTINIWFEESKNVMVIVTDATGKSNMLIINYVSE